MATLTADMKVSEMVIQNPGLARTFEELGIDFCCGGQRSLADACLDRGIALGEVLSALETSGAEAANSEADRFDPANLSLNQIVDHILETHHAYLERETPRLRALVEKVAGVHGAQDPRLQTLRGEFVALCQDLSQHLMKEEQILFPMIREMETSGSLGSYGCGSTQGPIGQMQYEHDEAGQALARIQELTDSFTAPEWACASYCAMIDGLREFTRDMHMHIHKENNVLFPRAAEIERGLE